MRRAIITGATGFIGSNLARRLVNDNWNVSIITRPESKYDYIEDIVDKLNIIEFNGKLDELIESFNRQKPEIVFHLASYFVAEHDVKDIEKLINSNLLFGTQILEAMKQTGVRKLVNTGTAWQHYKNEDYNPVCLYAATKKSFEDIIEYYVRAEKFNAITLKLFDTYGENDKRGKLINALSEIAKRGEVLKMSPGEQLIDLVHVDDVIRAFMRASGLLQNEINKHNKYGISSNNPVKLRDLIDIFNEISEREVKVKWGGREYRRREVMNTWTNYNQLDDWKPEISLQQGLKRIIEHE